VGQPELGILHLAFPCLSTKLKSDLISLLYASCSHRVAACLQSAGSVYWQSAAQGCDALFSGLASLAFLHKTKVLDSQNLTNGEAVMDLSDIDIFWLYSSLAEGGMGGMNCGIQGGYISPVV
jgi:hypothetical protein